jgi:hypothetical protein
LFCLEKGIQHAQKKPEQHQPRGWDSANHESQVSGGRSKSREMETSPGGGTLLSSQESPVAGGRCRFKRGGVRSRGKRNLG